ncbi:hypothetical protein [Noviherbaspirillum saxi]|nr:hypothetical protein [Noviherbaspirillum saxi]
MMKRSAAAVTLLLAIGLTHAAPVILTNAQMDKVSAGAQYSVVDGGGYAEAGTVLARADTRAKQNGSGTKTKADLWVKAEGTGLEAYGFGESVAGNSISSVYGEATADEGKIMIRVKTMSKEKSDGGTMTKSKIQIKSAGGGSSKASISSSSF